MRKVSVRPGLVADRYEVLSLLASGGMGDVYVARDRQLGRRVALKVLRDPSGSARFRAEAQTLARLRHPSLVAVLDLGESDGRPFLVLELVEGTTLAERCRAGGLDPGDVARIGEQLAGALAHVHAAGVVHRDVSPSNVLLSHDGSAHLADFGIARLLEDEPALTQAGQTLGTVPYLSPEQVAGEPVTPTADVYSLGLVLLEALTCRRAFDGSDAETAVARLQRDPEVPETLPAGWRELLTGMTAREPADRPSAADVQVRLAQLAEASVDVTRPLTVPLALPVHPRGTADRFPFAVSLPRSLPPWVPRSLPDRLPALTPAVWVGLLLLVTVLLIATWPEGGERQAPAVPRGVPSSVADELQELHDAVEGR